MTVPFAILAVLTIASAVAAMSLRHLVHCALALVVTLTSLAAVYLELDAQFVGFAQILVYVGAVAILIVFAILLTRSGEAGAQPIASPSWAVGIGIAVLVFAVITGCVLASSFSQREPPAAPAAATRQIGEALMTKFVLPLEVVGLLLTVALIGAVILAMKERTTEVGSPKSEVPAASSEGVALHPPSSALRPPP